MLEKNLTINLNYILIISYMLVETCILKKKGITIVVTNLKLNYKYNFNLDFKYNL